MDYQQQLFSKGNIISFLMIAILIVAIPVVVNLAQKQQQLKSQAAGEEIKFSGPTVTCDSGAATGEVGCSTTAPEVRVELNSPFGNPIGATQTQ